jgi:carbonic anhydrase
VNRYSLLWDSIFDDHIFTNFRPTTIIDKTGHTFHVQRSDEVVTADKVAFIPCKIFVFVAAMNQRRINVVAMALVFLVCSLKRTTGRSWKEVPRLHDHDPIDTSRILYLQQQDMLYKSQVDNLQSSLLKRPPRTIPQEHSPTTVAPSPSPSVHPTKLPTEMPTNSPTTNPTTTPSRSPTSSPTIDPYKDSESPENPDGWYFNYDASSRLGPGGGISLVQSQNGTFEVNMQPDHWGQVSRPPNDYWKEFGDEGFGPWKQTLQSHDLSKNVCSTGMLQSPINARENGALCHESHQIRTKPGDFQISGNRIKKRIESNKLRLIYDRRQCSNMTLIACQEPDPPKADFPHGWGGYADLLHIDFKIQSEHTLLNERFDAEMQSFHIHAGRRRLAAVSVMIRATEDGYNFYFQEAINAFIVEYNKGVAQCMRRLSEQKGGIAHSPGSRSLANNTTSPFNDYLSWAKHVTGKDNRQWDDIGTSEKLDGGVWNPYHEMLLPTIYFYRYDGSITEPPCGEFVSWWIADKPMIISFDQLEQLKTILFTNVDGNCKKTGVQHHRSVARPVQNTNNRPVWKCTAGEFGPDP